jgi:D5 N terminal like/Primase C terminal 2 (PriCT-2)
VIQQQKMSDNGFDDNIPLPGMDRHFQLRNDPNNNKYGAKMQDNIAHTQTEYNPIGADYDKNTDYDNPAEAAFGDGTYTEAPEISVEEIVQSKISKKIRDLKEFLSNGDFVTEKGDQRTNLISVSEKRTYCLPDGKVEEFFSILDECRREGRMLHYSERQETSTQPYSGIMIDFDRYQKGKEVEVLERHIGGLINRICKILMSIIDVSEHESDKGMISFHVFVIRKPSIALQPQKNPGDSPIYKDGWHILFPDIQVMKGVKKYLCDEIISRGVMKNVFRDVSHVEEPDKMLDKMSASNPVHFIGNSKPGRPAYPLVSAFNVTMFSGDDDVQPVALDLQKLLSGRAPDGTEINLTYETSLMYVLPTFNGKKTWLNKRKFRCKKELETKIQLTVEKTAGGIIADDDLAEIENSVDILTLGNAEAKHIKNLLSIVDSSYATEYEKWFKVMCAIAYTNVNYKPLAIWFSQRVPDKWSPHEVDRVWAEAINGRFNRVPITKRSILFWAKESAPQRFRELEKENYIEILSRYVYQNEGRVEHSMVAKIVHAMISDKFVVDTGVKDSGRVGYNWYEFVMPGQGMKRGEVYKWRRESDPDNVHLFISEHLPKIYSEQVQRIRDRKDAGENEAQAKYWANVEKTFRLYTSKLSNDTFQAGIVRQAQYKFRVRGFSDELDTYEDVIGVGNGVLKTGLEPRLIKSFHEFKISKFTETEYVPRNPNCKYQQELLEWSRGIFPEPDVNLFMWLHASTGVSMYESACILLLLVGGGQNGKTSWAKMIHNTLGNMYCAAGKATLLTSPMERGDSANSAQMQMRGKTFVYMDEFNMSVCLNDARVKSIVTPGWQSGRDLHEKQTNFKNTCNPVAISNYEFGVRTTDHGTWRRLYRYKAKMKFCKNPNPASPFEKKANGAWESKNPNDPNYKSAMLALLTYYNQILWRDYDGDLKNVPVPTIVQETEEFRNSQDLLNKFISMSIIYSPGCDATSVQTLAREYAEWYKRATRGEIITQSEAEPQIENSRLGTYLEYRQGGIKYLVDYRIREGDGPLREDELMLVDQENIKRGIPLAGSIEARTAAVRATVNTTTGPETAIHAPWVRPAAEGDSTVKDLIRNAPKHIQNTQDIIEKELILNSEDISALTGL